jgi:hypothetical protein
MKILVGQNHLHTIGGTETFTYTLIKELVRQGHEVELATFYMGLLSNKIEEDFSIKPNRLTNNYDLSLVNHNPVVEMIRELGIRTKKLIQTSHGFHEMERPSSKADIIVAISEEVSKSVEGLGFEKPRVILNGVDCERFNIRTELNPQIKNILSLSQSEKANSLLKKVSANLACNFESFNKDKNPIFNVEDAINRSDLVFGLGRSAFDALACGRPVFIWDNREYQGNLGDGYLTDKNFDDFVLNNCSGRRLKKFYSADEITEVIKDNYSDNSVANRNIALEKTNIEIQVQKYLNL